MAAKRRAGALGPGVPVAGTAVDGLAHTLGQCRGALDPPEDPRALAWALSRVLGGERPGPVPGRAYARQFTPSAAAAVYAGACRQLLASRATSGKPTGGRAAVLAEPQRWLAASRTPQPPGGKVGGEDAL